MKANEFLSEVKQRRADLKKNDPAVYAKEMEKDSKNYGRGIMGALRRKYDQPLDEQGDNDTYDIIRTDDYGKKDFFAGNYSLEQAKDELAKCLAHPLHTKYGHKFAIVKRNEQPIKEFAPGGTMKPPAPPTAKKKDPFEDDDRSQLLMSIKNLLNKGAKIDSYLFGARGHITGVANDYYGFYFKKLNKPHSKSSFVRPMGGEDDESYMLKLVKPGYYQLWDKSIADAGEQGVAEGSGDLKSELAAVYSKLAPKIERHRDSFGAGQLYDALEAVADKHGAGKQLAIMMRSARNSAHMEYDTNPGGFENWFWFLPFATDDEQGVAEGELREDAIPAKMVMQGFVVEYDPGTRTVVISKRGQELEKYRYNGQASLLSFQRNVGHRIKALEDDLYGGDDEAGAVSLSRVKVPGRGYGYQELGEDDSSTSSDEAESAILKRIMVAHLDLLKEVGPEKVMQAVEEVAYNIGDLDESDVSGWVHQVRDILGVPEPDQEEFLDEKWSTKYKRSIDCSHPKGFSQKAHCAGRKK